MSRPSTSQAAGSASRELTGSTRAVLEPSTNPLDQLSAAEVAETVAEVAGLPETTAVTNQAQTVNAELAVTPVNNIVAAKPQVVATDSALKPEHS